MLHEEVAGEKGRIQSFRFWECCIDLNTYDFVSVPRDVSLKSQKPKIVAEFNVDPAPCSVPLLHTILERHVDDLLGVLVDALRPTEAAVAVNLFVDFSQFYQVQRII